MLSRRQFLRLGSSAAAAALACRARPWRAPAAPEYDVCVVGSGFAGIHLALRLVEHGVRTVVLEAGPWLSRSAGDDVDVSLFPYQTTGEIAFPVTFNRTIAVGGTSRKWNGVVTRLLPTDFRTRSAFGLFEDWPIGYDDLVPYYCQAEQALCTAGAAAVAGAEPPRACESPTVGAGTRLPPGFACEQGLAFFRLAFSGRAGGPVRLGDVEVPRFAASASGTLRVESPVVRLQTRQADTGFRIVAADVRKPDGSIEQVRARCFIVAAGVVETQRLLLRSRSPEFPDGLGNRRDRLGRGFHAHPVFRVNVPLAEHHGPPPAGHHRSYTLNDRMRRAGFGSCHVDLHSRCPGPDVDLVVEMEPHAQNRVTLDGRDEDAVGRPSALAPALRVHLDWSPIDRRTLARGDELHRSFEACLAPRGRAAGKRRVIWFHPAGGCAMGADESTGVVDAQCRVFGFDNLYVGGASVFPTSGSGNPTLTVVALALRLADHLRTELGRAGAPSLRSDVDPW
jgi:choline dehydrogenase-like flavoprotein